MQLWMRGNTYGYSRNSKLQHTATRCNTMQDTATHCYTLQYTSTHCNELHTLQHTATNCNTLQHTGTHCNTLQLTSTHCNTLQHTATHCDTLQHTATHCNTLQRFHQSQWRVHASPHILWAGEGYLPAQNNILQQSTGWWRPIGCLKLQVIFGICVGCHVSSTQHCLYYRRLFYICGMVEDKWKPTKFVDCFNPVFK